MSEENLESAKVAHLCKRLRHGIKERATGLENNGHTRIRVMVEDFNEGQTAFPDGSYLVCSLDSATYQLPGLRKGKLVRVGGGNRKFIVSDARGNIGKDVAIIESEISNQSSYEMFVTVMDILHVTQSTMIVMDPRSPSVLV